jgi:hypothetical protein
MISTCLATRTGRGRESAPRGVNSDLMIHIVAYKPAPDVPVFLGHSVLERRTVLPIILDNFRLYLTETYFVKHCPFLPFPPITFLLPNVSQIIIDSKSLKIPVFHSFAVG